MPARAALDGVALDALADRALAVIGDRPRAILGIAGSPGSGKTTLAAALVRRIGERMPDAAVALPMDGFHLANATLDRLGRHDRKGAIDTFDGWGLAALLGRLRSETANPVYAPGFDRAVDEGVAGAVAVEPAHRLVVVEGNYLLDETAPWDRVAGLLDAAWFVVTPEPVRLARLVDRHVRHGRTPAAARDWAERVDGANARRIEATAARAALRVSGEDLRVLG